MVASVAESLIEDVSNLIAIYTCHTLNVSIFGSNHDSGDCALFLQIISRYDLIMIQELQDASQTEFPKLMNALKFFSGIRYTPLKSMRLGENRYKEQYIYVYR